MRPTSADTTKAPGLSALPDMDARVPTRTLWELFVALHPVFKKAIQKSAHKDQFGLHTRNYIKRVRYGLCGIPLSSTNGSLDQTKLDDHDFIRSLYSLLEVLETLVRDDIDRKNIAQAKDPTDPSEQWKLRYEFPRLSTMWCLLRGMTPTNHHPSSPPKHQRQSMRELAEYIDFFPPKHNRQYESTKVVERILMFRSVVDKLLRAPIEALEKNIGNPTQLLHDETNFIQRAHQLSNLSCKLFNLLVGSLPCSGVHEAQLYLSGFLASEVNFELFIEDCKQKHWNYAKCRWDVDVYTTKDCRVRHDVCYQHLNQAVPRQTRLAFGQEGLWDDWDHDGDVYSSPYSGSDPTLRELIMGKRHDTSLEVFKLKAKEKRTLELLIACSLLNLSMSHWIREGLDTDKISVRKTNGASDFLARWKPHIACPLQTAEDEFDEDRAVLSFGILLMEMEAGQAAEATESEMDWDGSEISKDILLKRILDEWSDDVEDDYREIASACLFFSQLSEKFYDPHLEQETMRTGAIYKYILAPLFRVVTQKFRESLQLFTGIPKPAWSRSISSNDSVRQYESTTSLKLFDGSTAASPTQQNIKDAAKFMVDLGGFAERIENITETSTVPTHATWRSTKIRIAILDTGIDTDDVLVETALKDKRIQERVGFVNGPDMDPDPEDYRDTNSHGTHVARLVLNAAPSAEVLIAKISDHSTVDAHDLHRIARAIKWATKMKVNIISMSLGLDNRDTEIDIAIQAAVNANISVFAASSNEGGNKTRAWPAKRNHGVICIHASDGKGNDGEINPTPQLKGDNFTTLGIAIPSKWKGEPLFISGTSFSTPIAAALVANVLEFARHRCGLSKHQQDKLHRYDGVRQVLELMLEEGAGTRGGYDYVWPFHLWTPGRADRKVAELIANIADS
ncbi:subtilisin-like protein [Apiospora arundinis]|uniref:Subtilisin-like protein n=1 Tax=Apiospora arundinis TaxID=335852 RepID=A0ABR2JIL5_9PEZI